MSIDPYWQGKCSDPPEESCADAGCPVHGDDEFRESEWDSEDSNAYAAEQEREGDRA